MQERENSNTRKYKRMFYHETPLFLHPHRSGSGGDAAVGRKGAVATGVHTICSVLLRGLLSGPANEETMSTSEITFIADQLVNASEFYTCEEFAREMATQTSLTKKQGVSLWNTYFALDPMERMELGFYDGVNQLIMDLLN